MTRFRVLLFWLHLAAGLIAGLFIGVMCFTGTIIACEDEIVAWAERDARQVAIPAATAPMPLPELQGRLRADRPDFKPAGFVLWNDPAAAMQFSSSRDGSWFVNPYTGESLRPASTKVYSFMELMLRWHRFLGREGDSRPAGKLVNGICNLAFLVLAVSGLYLWMPRTRSWAGVKAGAIFNFKAGGKARDFNWHNVIGLWCAPVLIVLTLTAVPISFRWGSNLIYRLVGEEPPAQQAPANASTPAFEIKKPAPDSQLLAHDVLVANIQKEFPRWSVLTLRTASLQRGAQAQPPSGSAPTAGANPAPGETAGKADSDKPKEPPPLQPLTVTVRESGSWPRTATTTLTLNPFTGEILKREGFGDFSLGRQIRTWTRYLHTGQAIGWPGQLLAGLACLGALFLVYTGFALSWRRFVIPRRLTTAKAAENSR